VLEAIATAPTANHLSLQIWKIKFDRSKQEWIEILEGDRLRMESVN